MNVEQLKQVSDPWQRLVWWIQERESIRLNRLNMVPKPWTENEILQRYKFCNVRRMDDRVSQWLMDNWYVPNFDHNNMLTACTLARFFNNTDSLRAHGFPLKWNAAASAKLFTNRERVGQTNFSGAYLVTGCLGGTKIEQVVFKIVDPLHKAKIPFRSVASLEEMVKLLAGRLGIGSFLAGQIACDLRWAARVLWPDVHTFAPMGPGSQRGLNRLHGRPLNQRIKYEQFREELNQMIGYCLAHVPESITERLEAIDYQNCLCEFDKMERTLREGRRPKQNYPGV